MDRLFRHRNVNVYDLLCDNFGDPVKVIVDDNDAKKTRSKDNADKDNVSKGHPRWRWQTSYGFSVETLSFKEDSREDYFMYLYRYDDDLPFPLDGGMIGEMIGAIGKSDVPEILNHLARDPDMLRKKPESIIEIEKATCNSDRVVKVDRKYNKFGSWHIIAGDPAEISMFNNPFGLATGYTRSADDFEIWDFQGDPEGYQPVSVAISTLVSAGFGHVGNN